MFEALFGNQTVERVLLFLANYEVGYASEMARTYEIPVSMIQKQLTRLEKGQIVVSHLIGKTRIYQLNPRWFFYKDIVNLLNKALDTLPKKDIKRYYRQRRRPRRKDKPNARQSVIEWPHQ